MTGFRSLLLRELTRFVEVPINTIIAPTVSALLFIFVFSAFISPAVGTVEGVQYVHFIIPGLVLLSVVVSSYANGGFSFYMSKLLKYVEDLFVAPLTYAEIVLAYLIAASVRALSISFIVFLVAVVFTGMTIFSVPLLILSIVLVSFTFSSLGIIVAIFAKEFEHVELPTTFILTPLIFLGGVFNSIQMFPEAYRWVSQYNPIYYMVNNFRYAATGIEEANILLSIAVNAVLLVIFFSAALYLMKKGKSIRK